LCPEDVGTLESFVYGDTPSLESVRLMLKLFYESAVEEKGGDAWMGFKKGEESVAEARLSMFSLGCVWEGRLRGLWTDCSLFQTAERRISRTP
jgi:hypothetical protein